MADQALALQLGERAAQLLHLLLQEDATHGLLSPLVAPPLRVPWRQVEDGAGFAVGYCFRVPKDRVVARLHGKGRETILLPWRRQTPLELGVCFGKLLFQDPPLLQKVLGLLVL